METAIDEVKNSENKNNNKTLSIKSHGVVNGGIW